MATYYISTTGNNSTGDGSSGNPWATLSYAISNVTTFGDIIHVNAGIYPAITSQMLLPNGVSIEGAGRTVTTIPLTYSAGKPCIKAETWAAWSNKTVGYQHISGIKFVGSTTPGTPVGIVAIGVNFRHHFEIYDCWFEDFVESAVYYQGEPTYSLDDDAGTRIDNPYETRVGYESAYLPYEDSFCEGNKFYNNEVHNCCVELNHTTHDASGALEFSMQDGFLVYGNNMTALGRSSNYNGVPIKMIIGFNRNTKIYNNTINAGHKSTNYWQFSIEVWWDLGGLEIYNNTLNGSIDLCDSWDQYGIGYGARIYDNDVGYSSSANQWEPGIRLEGSHVDTYVFRNKFHNINIGIEVNNNNVSGATRWNGVYIYDNLMVDLSGPSWQCWGIYWGGSGIITNTTDVWQNIYIQHNTIVAASTSIDPTTYGIMLPTVEDVNNLYIENNILINWERGAIWGDKTRVQATNINIRNNLIYDSYNSNDPVYLNSYPTTGITYSGTVKADPLFVSSTDWHLSGTSSPAYHAGVYVGLSTDLDGVSWNNPPSIGAYEYISDPPIANFIADTTPIYTGDSVEFTDTSTNTPTSWSWNFGDGGTSTQQNPSHTFLTAGTFTITLTSTNDYGSDTETKINYITVVIPGLAPVSGFIVNDTTAYIGQTIYFTDQSLNAPTSWLWNFGDGDSSINQNPTHSYSTVGIFTVTLIVTNTYGTDTETKVDYIIVTDPNPPDGCLVQIPFMRFFII